MIPMVTAFLWIFHQKTDDITNTSFLNRIVDVFALPEEADDSLSDDDNVRPKI